MPSRTGEDEMMNLSRTGWTALAVMLSLSHAPPVRGQEAEPAANLNMAQAKLVTFPGFPTCATGAVVNGDPAKGPSIILSKVAPGCSVPWHWHTPNEHLMIVSGVATAQMKDGQPVTLRAGGFAAMPSHHTHKFSCRAGCVLYVHSDAPFDIHYVDAQGKEITPEEATKAVKETAGKPAP